MRKTVSMSFSRRSFSDQPVGSPQYARASWLRRSRKRLFTGVADNMSTLVFTPCLMTFSMSNW